MFVRQAPAQQAAEIDDRGVSLPWNRLSYFYARRAYPNPQIPANARHLAWLRAQRLPAYSFRRSGIGIEGSDDWEFVGPFATNLSWLGRVNAILVHPTNPDVLYAGCAKGGVWKSADAGTTWTNLTDALTQYVGCLAFDPNNPDIVYLGTGEEYFAGWTLGGVGIYRSTDGGAHWTLYGNATFAGLRINEIVVDPTNANRWIVSSDGGIYVTTDGGASFTRTLYGVASALRIHPTHPNRLYAALGYPFSGAAYNGLYLSNDGGATWKQIAASGLPAGTATGRIELDICRSRPNVLYAVFSNPYTYFVGSIWKTTDGGATWAKTAYAGFKEYGQTWYDLFIRVDPTDPDIVYMGDVHAWRSTDGGASWRDITGDHTDMHALAFDPTNPQRIYLGEDGGLYDSTSRGDSWIPKNSGRGTMEFYGLDTHPTDPGQMAAGAQDNGTAVRANSNTYDIVIGRDGFTPAYDSANPQVVLGEIYYGTVYRSTDGGSSFATRPVCDLSKEARVGWSVPLVNDVTRPSRFYAGSYRLWRSSSDGAAGTWATCSGDLTKGGGGVLAAIAVAPSQGDTVYTGASDGAVFVSTNATASAPTWTNRSAGLPNAGVGGIAADPADPKTIYVSMMGYSIPHIWKSADGGATWINYSGDLPDTPVSALAVNPQVPSQLMAATDVGVFITLNNGINWLRLGNALPNVPCTGIRANATTGYVSVSTYGRGIWRLALPTTNAAVSGTVTLSGISATAQAQTLTFTFRPARGAPFTRTANILPDGRFMLSDIPPNTYDLAIKGAKWLQKVVTGLSVKGQTVSGVTATLLPGDINNDNKVSLADLGLLADAFDTTPADPDWNANADLNCDGKVDIIDLGLLTDSYGKNGDP
jgi:photosystem II stability/assembly factor-like uncharacterized protein